MDTWYMLQNTTLTGINTQTECIPIHWQAKKNTLKPYNIKQHFLPRIKTDGGAVGKVITAMSSACSPMLNTQSL